MRLVPLLLVMLAAPAHAEFVMCLNGRGVVPEPGTVVPPRTRLIWYADQNMAAPEKITAKIDGKVVPLKRAERHAAPFKLLVLEIDSDRTGELSLEFNGSAATKWTVKPIEIPKEIKATTARYRAPAHDGERTETFDGLVIKLPEGTPALLGTVKVRSDASRPWQEILSPVYKPESEARPQLRVGEFECASNVSLAELARGFDLEVSLVMLDGSTRAVTGFAPHLSLPALLPPQPRPKNQRR